MLNFADTFLWLTGLLVWSLAGLTLLVSFVLAVAVHVEQQARRRRDMASWLEENQARRQR